MVGHVYDAHAAAAKLAEDLISRYLRLRRGHRGCIGRNLQRIDQDAVLVTVDGSPDSSSAGLEIPERGVGQSLQRLLASGAVFHVQLQLFAHGVGKPVSEEEIELLAIRAGCHSSPSNFRISSWIIFLTSLLAT